MPQPIITAPQPLTKSQSTYSIIPSPNLTPSSVTIKSTWYYTSTVMHHIFLNPRPDTTPADYTYSSSGINPCYPPLRAMEPSMLFPTSCATSLTPPPKPKSVPSFKIPNTIVSSAPPFKKWCGHNHNHIHIHNSCTECIINDTIKQRLSKAIDMRFYWVRNHVWQGQFLVHWKKGLDNLYDYFKKHHPPKYHYLMLSTYLHNPNNAPYSVIL